MAHEILYSRHARERMVLRGISRKEVETAIRRGTKVHQGSNIVAGFHYFEVVYAVRGEVCYVITVKLRW